jgi:hypothetical protein
MSALVCSGDMYKLGGGAIARHQKRFFELRNNGALTYYDKQNGEEKGAIYVEGARVVDRGTYQGKLCFSIEGVNLAKGVKEYFLFLDDAATKWMWYQNIQRLTKRYDFLFKEPPVAVSLSAEDVSVGGAARGTSPLPLTDRRILASSVYQACIATNPSNEQCADCSAPHPTWSVGKPYGGFVCIECIGVHRSLWAPLCKEVELDKWTDEEISYIREGRGNQILNEELEYHVPSTIKKPNPWSSRVLREAFITKKYNRAFTKEEGRSDPLPPMQDTAVKGDATARAQFGSPPKYLGVAFVMLNETTGYGYQGCVAVLTNGFQEVRSRGGAKVDNSTTRWNEPLQIGVDNLRRPLYITLYEGENKIAGTGELVLEDVEDVLNNSDGEPKQVSMILTGKSISSPASLIAKVTFTRLS